MLSVVLISNHVYMFSCTDKQGLKVLDSNMKIHVSHLIYYFNHCNEVITFDTSTCESTTFIMNIYTVNAVPQKTFKVTV